MAGTDTTCIRNIVMSLSEKFDETNGLRDKVMMAESEMCLKYTLVLPKPLSSKFCK